MKTVWDVIKGPVVTEKALTQKEQTAEGKQLLTFRVDSRASKPQIRQAVESIFKVKVDDVRVVSKKGKRVRRGRIWGKRPDWKKAYVTLSAGQKPVEYGELI